MLQNNASATLGVPLWLAVLTAVLLVTRAGVWTYDQLYPRSSANAVVWKEPVICKTDADLGRPLNLYAFSAEWCPSCKSMDRTAFQNKRVVSLMKSGFNTFSVVDRKRDDGKNSAVTAFLLKLYKVSAYPTLVVTLPNGRLVSSATGAKPAQVIYDFLQRVLKESEYNRGFEYLCRHEFSKGIAALKTYLQAVEFANSKESLYAASYCALALRLQDRRQEASALLAEAIVKLKPKEWPFAALEYLNGRLSESEFIKAGSEDNDRLADMHVLLAGNLLAAGDSKKAEEHLNWVKESAEKGSFEQRFATALLRDFANLESLQKREPVFKNF